MRILMLASDAHGGHGGIAQYNRDVLAAFSDLAQIEEVVVLPRLIADASFSAPPNVRYDRKAARGRLAFVWRTLVAALREGRFDLIFCGHINLLPLAALAKMLLGARLILAVHGTDVWERPRGLAASRCLPVADMILSVSQFTIDRMSRWWPAVRQCARVIPNTVEAGRFGKEEKNAALAAELGLAGKPVIMTLGRMAADERAKGFDEVIELMPRLLARTPDLVYLCLGEGDDRARLQAKALGLGLERSVIFTGSIPEQSKPDYFRLADAYVMASCGEGFGIVLLEAMACGIPVVGSTADATQEALLHGELGPSVDPRSPDQLAEAILAAVRRPKGVPSGLSYYSPDKFRARMGDALEAVLPS